ncbi:hypothetical protein PAMP_018516 [Pampus punctatissimus]
MQGNLPQSGVQETPNHLNWLPFIQRSSGSTLSSSRTSLLVTYNCVFSTSVLNHPGCYLCKLDKWLDVIFRHVSIIRNFSDKVFFVIMLLCLQVCVCIVCVWMRV